MSFARLTIANPELPVETQQELVARLTRLLASDLNKDCLGRRKWTSV